MPFDLNDTIDFGIHDTIEVHDISSFNPQHFFTDNTDNLVNYLHMNIRSINKNFDQFICYLNQCETKFHVIVLSETWITDDSQCGFLIDGYRTIYKKNRYTKSDGLCLFIQNEIDFVMLDHEIDKANCLSVELKIENRNYTLLSVYRSPSLNIADFINSFDSFLQNTVNDSTFLIVGDMNLNLLENCNITNEYLSAVHLNGFRSFINKPTRVQGNSNSCIDHIFLKNRNTGNENVIGTIIKSNITDHFITTIHINNKKIQSQNNRILNEKIKIDYENLCHSLESEKWENILKDNRNDMDELVDNFLNALTNHIKRHTKVAHIPHKKIPLKQWISQGIINSIRKRDKMHSQLRKQPFNIRLKEEYKNYRNTLNKLIKDSKIKYYNDKFHLYKGDMKKTWECIKELTNSKNKEFQPKLEASVLNKHFATVGQTYAEKLIQNNAINIPESNSISPINSFFMTPTNAAEINKFIHELKPNSSPGADNLGGTCLKKISKFITQPLELIFNKCFELGYFPRKFKVALIKPIPKTKDLENPSNYRPISLLSNLSKIMEKIIKVRLMDFLNKNNFIAGNQYGFQKNKSTKDAVLHLTDIVNRDFDNNKKTLAVFLDLAKAFDTIPHCILLNKLELSGIRGVTNDLFASYLTDRLQILKLNNKTDIQNIKEFGLPQGTVLSPILFLIYVNELLKLEIPNGITLSFADDTALIFSGSTWNETFNFANQGLSMVKSWLNCHILTLNANKTKYITFSPNRSGQPPEDLSLSICSHNNHNNTNCTCTSIERVNSIKYLGVTVDQHIKWDIHIQNLCLKLKYLISIFYKINQLKDLNIIRTIYYAFAHSLLNYNIEVWGAAYDTHFNKLFIIQKHIIRAALGRPRLYPSRLIFEEIKLPTLRQTYVTNLILFINKNRHLFTARTIPYNIRPTTLNPFNTQFTSLTSCKRQYMYQSNRLINKVPDYFINERIAKNRLKFIKAWVRQNYYFKIEN
jgi:hypothetical protein